VAIEFRDYVAAVEAPLGERRSLAVIAEVRKLVPSKSIDYIVNTHHHFTIPAGFAPTSTTRGSAIITWRGNRDFYGPGALFAQGAADARSGSPVAVPARGGRRRYRFETVVEKYTLSDGARTMEVHHVQGLNHVKGMLIAFLPKEKIVIEADLYNAPASGHAGAVTDRGREDLPRERAPVEARCRDARSDPRTGYSVERVHEGDGLELTGSGRARRNAARRSPIS